MIYFSYIYRMKGKILCNWLHIHNWNKSKRIGQFLYPVYCKRCHILNKHKLNDYDDIMEMQMRFMDCIEDMKMNDDRYDKLKDILNDKGENILTIYRKEKK
jgi:hypothetical protein